MIGTKISCKRKTERRNDKEERWEARTLGDGGQSLVEAIKLVWDLPRVRGLLQGLQKGPWT